MFRWVADLNPNMTTIEKNFKRSFGLTRINKHRPEFVHANFILHFVNSKSRSVSSFHLSSPTLVTCAIETSSAVSSSSDLTGGEDFDTTIVCVPVCESNSQSDWMKLIKSFCIERIVAFDHRGHGPLRSKHMTMWRERERDGKNVQWREFYFILLFFAPLRVLSLCIVCLLRAQ